MTGLSIDDDPLIGETIGYFCAKSEGVEECVHAADAAAGLNALASRCFDFVLLDLHLPDGSGQSILEAIPAETPVVLVTSDPDFGAASYRFDNVVDYLVKPIEFVRFRRALERVRQFQARTNELPEAPAGTFFVKSGSDHIQLVTEEVAFLKAEANYVRYHRVGGQSVMVLTSLTKALEALPDIFLRVHRSYAVNRNRVERVEGAVAVVGGERIPISESYRAGFLESLGIGS